MLVSTRFTFVRLFIYNKGTIRNSSFSVLKIFPYSVVYLNYPFLVISINGTIVSKYPLINYL